MPEENQQPANPAAKMNVSTPSPAGAGPGAAIVGPIGIILITMYLVVATLLCLYGLIALWPGPSPSGKPPQSAAAPTSNSASVPEANSDQSGITPSQKQPSEASPVSVPSSTPSPITMFGLQFKVWDEVRLLLITILAGALGSLVRALRSVYWYVGNRQLVRSWLGQYILLPFVGSALAVIFYVVVRGGFFSPQATFEQTSPFGFAALAAMVGLFSEQAVLKLKQVAETVLAKPAPGNDNMPQGSDT